MTPLRRDPAAGWMTSGGHFFVTVKSMIVWLLFVPLLVVIWLGVDSALYIGDFSPNPSGRMTNPMEAAGYVMNAANFGGASRYGITPGKLVAVFAFIVLLAPARSLALAIRVRATVKEVQPAAEAAASPIDDLATIESEADGTVVSIVGWVRGHGYLLHRAGGEQAVGMALPCRGQHLLEMIHNFDLLDEAGSAALVVTQGARMLGKPNLVLSRANEEDRNLVHSLDMPAGMSPANWGAYVLRDGDPVMVIGVKSTVQDASELQHGRSPNRTAVTSDARLPLLVIPLAAERRDV